MNFAHIALVFVLRLATNIDHISFSALKRLAHLKCMTCVPQANVQAAFFVALFRSETTAYEGSSLVLLGWKNPWSETFQSYQASTLKRLPLKCMICFAGKCPGSLLDCTIQKRNQSCHHAMGAVGIASQHSWSSSSASASCNLACTVQNDACTSSG